MLMALNVLSIFKFISIISRKYFTIWKNRYGVYVVKGETWKEGFPKSKKSIYTNIISHFNKNVSNNLKTSNSDNVIGTSKFHHRNVQNGGSFNTLNTLRKLIDTESSVSINDEMTYTNNTRKWMSSHQNSTKTIDH